MNEYLIRFSVSGRINVKAESMTAAVDRIMENFRDAGANQLYAETVRINGEEMAQSRKDKMK